MHAYDQPEIVAGQGTIGAELSEQVPDAHTVLVAIGGGGLIAGIAAWYEGRTRVIGVEPERCPTMT
jgi:threonine dehydratase